MVLIFIVTLAIGLFALVGSRDDSLSKFMFEERQRSLIPASCGQEEFVSMNRTILRIIGIMGILMALVLLFELVGELF